MDFKRGGFSTAVIDVVLKLAFIAALLIYTYDVLNPFFDLITWALLISISVAPFFQRVTRWFRGRRKLAAVTISALFLLIVIGPIGFITGAFIQNLKEIKSKLDSETIAQFQPNPAVKDWPIIGNNLYQLWAEITWDQEEFLDKHNERIMQVGETVVLAIANTGKSVLLFMGAMIIVGFLLLYTDERQSLGVKIGRRLGGEKGEGFSILVEKTIRSVVTGVLGVAVIQATLAGIGIFVMDIPFPAIWTVAALFLAVIQIGVGPIVFVAVIYGFMYHDTTPAVIFLIWNVLVTLSDNVLKPILMGRGLDVPMAVIFIGAIGGVLFDGIMGLFLGPVVLSLVYKLFITWLKDGDTELDIAADNEELTN